MNPLFLCGSMYFNKPCLLHFKYLCACEEYSSANNKLGSLALQVALCAHRPHEGLVYDPFRFHMVFYAQQSKDHIWRYGW